METKRPLEETLPQAFQIPWDLFRRFMLIKILKPDVSDCIDYFCDNILPGYKAYILEPKRWFWLRDDDDYHEYGDNEFEDDCRWMEKTLEHFCCESRDDKECEKHVREKIIRWADDPNVQEFLIFLKETYPSVFKRDMENFISTHKLKEYEEQMRKDYELD